MNDEHALLAAIAANPDDDTVRLAYADWLDEHGGEVNVAWAELIRVQIALVGDAVGERHQLLAREQSLLPLVLFSWSERLGLPGGDVWCLWVRGFPLRYADFSSPDLGRFALAPPLPLREVDLIDALDEEFVEFLKWPGLRTVRELALWELKPPFTMGILALARCEYLSNLERLRMARVSLTDEAAIALLDSPYLTRLTDVRIHEHPGRSVSYHVSRRLAERFGEEWDRL